MTISSAPISPDLADSSPSFEPELNESKLADLSTTEADTSTSQNGSSMQTGGGYFTGKEGHQLFEQWWVPNEPKAAIILVHGYAEHSGRYAHVAETFVSNGYAVYTYDHRSHGQSDGKDTFIASFDDVVDELGLFIKHKESQVEDLPLFVLGHSMGGLIVSLFMAIHEIPVNGVILSGAYVEINDDVPKWLVKVAAIIGKLLPNLPTIGLDYKLISRDEEMLAKHQSDPYIYRGKLPARTGAEMNFAVQKIKQMTDQITAPLLIMHGGDDQIAPVNGSKDLYSRAGSDDKSLKVYDGLYHEILNELERETVMADIVAWMDERCDKPKNSTNEAR